jgi:hypothetical protein
MRSLLALLILGAALAVGACSPSASSTLAPTSSPLTPVTSPVTPATSASPDVMSSASPS